MKRITVGFDGFLKGGENTLNHEARILLELLQKHFVVEISDNPDYIFCNVNSTRYYECDGIRIFCTIEAICPDFNLCDYGIGFEYIQYKDRYFRFPNFYFNPYIVRKMIQKHIVVAPEFAQRDFCSFVYSNTNADPIRGKLFEALSNYKKVNSGGKYLNNLPEGKSVEDKFIFESGHKFSIACENASHPGYHTEKLAEAFAAGTIPIYWGDPEITKVFNEKAFINCNHYTSMEAVIERVIYLDEHPDEYIAMLREPALLQECGLDFPERKLAELEAYLVHIFSQEKEQAYRRNRGFWGRQYQQKVLSTESVIKKYNKLRNLLPIKWLRKLKENI